MNQHADQQTKKMRLLLALPVLVLPFVTMAFWALGGGKDEHATTNTAQGYNINLPKANFKHEGLLDKMSYYDQADRDSIKEQEHRRSDMSFAASGIPAPDTPTMLQYSGATNMQLTNNAKSPAEQRVYDRLADINRALAAPPPNATSLKTNTNSSSDDIDRLESMLGAVRQPQQPDQELEQLNGMMDKILDVQHPERVKQRIKEQSIKLKQGVFPVRTAQDETDVSLLKGPVNKLKRDTGFENARFFSLPQTAQDTVPQTAIDAVIYDKQTLVDGSTVKLRLTTDVFINGTLIPKGTPVYGIASLGTERLMIEVNTIRFADNIFPVSLATYDLDGVAGIYIPGAINRDVSKQSADQSIQSIGINSLDNSIGAQAATAGITAAKTLLSRKVKIVRVNIPAGYKVLLRDTKNNNNE